MKRLLLLLAACFLLTGPVFADAADGKALTVRTFQLKHKDADKAAAAIKSLMSPEGSLSIQPGSNSLVVTDRPDNVREVVAALSKFDAPAQSFHLTIRIVGAGRDAASTKVPKDLEDVAPKLAMLRFNSFEKLGDADVVGREGDPGVVDLSPSYRADFRFGDYDPASDTIRISDFRLSRLQGAQKDQLASVLKTSLNLKLGQTVILGASKVADSQRALMIVIAARR